MRIYECGENNTRTLLMFQCAIEPVWVFFPAVRKLSKYFHVFLAGADGHDPNENTDFTSIEDYAHKAVDALKQRGITELYALYGVSMGGPTALYLLSHQLIPVKYALIDAGITPYQYPKWLCRFISYRDFCLIPLGTLNINIMKAIMPPEEWTPEGEDKDTYYNRIFDFEKHHLSSKTNHNVFWSCNNYEIPDPLPSLSTKITYWYGSKEKRDRKQDIAFMKKRFPQVPVTELEEYGRAQLVMIHPGYVKAYKKQKPEISALLY